MPSRIDITGQRFNRLTVIEQVGSKYNRPLWKCRCDCGNEVYELAGNLRRGSPRSCGCIRTKHGCSPTKKQKVSREYRTWCSARKRCRNPTDKNFHRYGGRGISFSERWDDFTVFLSDMGKCPPGLTLDRIDNNGNYELGNCRWATPAEQSANRHNTRRHLYHGEYLTTSEIARKLGTKTAYISTQMAKGETLEMIEYRIKSQSQGKKIWHRHENSAAARLTPTTVAAIIIEAHSIPIIGSRRAKGYWDKIGNKYGVNPKYARLLCNGKTNWMDNKTVQELIANVGLPPKTSYRKKS